MNRPHLFMPAILFAVLTNQAHAAEYGKIPLAFEPNVGQTDARVRFLSHAGGVTALFTDTETALVLNGQQTVRMHLKGAAVPRRVIGTDRQPGISNYFIGNDPAKWRTRVPHYGSIEYQSVYKGIDLLWYGNQQQLEYDFVVEPGADPGLIQVAYEGVESLKVEANGDMLLHTASGDMRQQKPKVYQEIAGRRVEIDAHYSILARNQVTFELAQYNRKLELRLDPVVLAYSTYLGGSGQDNGIAVAVDSAGSAYITGHSSSSNFPTLSPVQATNHNGVNGGPNVIVTKLTPAGDALVYSTYLGGSGGGDFGSAIAIDAAGSCYVTGSTTSVDFPTESPFQAANKNANDGNGFVTKLSPAGDALVYSTYLGGSTGIDAPYGIAVDAAGSAYVTGDANSTDFPTKSPYQATMNGRGDAFVTKFTPAGNALVYSTYLGGSSAEGGEAIAVDRTGAAYIVGGTSSTNFPTVSAFQAANKGSANAFVTKLTPAGNALAYSTYLGGSSSDYAYGIAVDLSGSAYIVGTTSSTNFPTQSAYQSALQGTLDVFVAKLTPAGSALSYSTYLGGSGYSLSNSIAVDAAGSAYVAGYTASTNFPIESPFQAAYVASGDAFVTKLAPAGNALVYSTYLGNASPSVGIKVDGDGAAYLAGSTLSTTFPTQSAFQATFQGSVDVFVTKLSPFGAGAPIGSFDTPATSPSNVNGSVGFTGWAISAAGIASVGIYRDPNPGEATQSNGLVYIGTASSIAGSRTDIAALYPTYPESNSAGWGFLILTNELPSNSGNTGVGNGTYNIHAIALDLGGNSKDLGTKTIVVDNKDALTPFGGIDTPAQGATVSGTKYVNFGWALTPQPKSIPTNGSTIVVYIDAKPMGHPVYNNPRSDIETLFPGYANTDGAIGYFYIDTTTLTNGLHTISWGVTDSAGQKSGIGSRFFTVQN